MPSPSVVILGAGPAGLTAAYELAKAGVNSTVLEGDNTVGGLARTAVYKGYRFDIGGHRFFTKVTPVEELWIEILGDDLLTRPRLSRIYYNGKFFSYPLKPFNALFGLGIFETTRWRRQLRLGPAVSATARGRLRYLGDEPLWETALRSLLQDLHGESLGHPPARKFKRSGPLSVSKACR